MESTAAGAVRKVTLVVRGVLDWRTIKTARSLTEAGFAVSILVATHFSAEWNHEPFAVRYIMPVEVRPSLLPWRPARVFSNLVFKRLTTRMRSARWGVFGERLIEAELSVEEPDIVYAINADVLEACGNYAKAKGVPLIYEAYEYWPDHSKETVLRATSAQRVALRAAERACIREATLVITVSDSIAKAYQKEYQLEQTPEVIYNAPRNHRLEAQPVHDPLKLLFLGNLQAERNVQLMLEAAARVPEVDMTFLGFGDLAQHLRAEARRFGASERIRVLAPVPPDELIDAASAYDVGIVAHSGQNQQMQGALPNKFFEYLAAGLAVVAVTTEAFQSFPELESCAILLSEPSVEQLCDALRSLSEQPQKVLTLKRGAVELAKRYCGDVQTIRLQQVVISALGQPSETA